MESRTARLEVAPTSTSPPVEAKLLATADSDGLLFLSGQIAVRNGELVAKGLVGREVALELAQECARQCALNLLSTLRKELGSLDDVERVLRLGVYVASDDEFSDQHLVAHGASQLMIQIFGENGLHSRTAIGVKKLPNNSPVEVDAIVKLASGAGPRR